jgi:glycosyltransferase involved in cell wall biosynthesis
VLAGRVPKGEPVPAGTQTLGYVPRSDLAALYGAATITAVPSRYEGFGHPPLEAMTCGSVVIASRVASLPEVLGDAAVLVPVGDVDAWAKAIVELANDDDRRAELRAVGRAHTMRLTWAATADNTAAVYRSLGIELSVT